MGKSGCDKKKIYIKNKVAQNWFYTKIQTKHAFRKNVSLTWEE